MRERAENNRHLLFAASVGAKEPVQGDVHGSVVAIKVLWQNKCEMMLSDHILLQAAYRCYETQTLAGCARDWSKISLMKTYGNENLMVKTYGSKNLMVKHMKIISTAGPLESVMAKPGSHRTVNDHGQCVHLKTPWLVICPDDIDQREEHFQIGLKFRKENEE